MDRLTRIYYKNRYFNYPIKAFDALTKLGSIASLHSMLSFAAAQFGRQVEPVTFEDWIRQKFGQKLYETFFKTYTEKVWGIPCNQIGAEWAAQRIKGLDIIQVIKNSFFNGNGSNNKIKTLVEQFDYPIFGAGQMYEAMCDKAVLQGAEVMLGTKVVSFNANNSHIESIDIVTSDGKLTKITANQFFNSIPITHFFKMLSPSETEPILQASDALYYRDHITVHFRVHADDLFPDQWIYIHSPDVQMARIANYNNFSKSMIRKKNRTALSVEYFVFQHEHLYKSSDESIKDLAIDELEYLGLAKKSQLEQAWVVRETECYPTYYIGFQQPYNLVKSRIDQFSNLYPIGRAGLYKYNNQDHSIMSGILAARNYLKFSGSPYDLWHINIDAEYHENAKRTYE